MVTFAFLDWFWLIAFLLLMVGSGFLFYRLGKRSEADFFLAGRGLPWWLPASSVYATHTATDTPMWVSGVVYRHGISGLWYTFFSAWCAVSAFVSTKIFRRSMAFTQAEWQSLRFGGLSGELLRGWTAGWQVFLNMFILGWVGMAIGKVCRYAFGWPLWIGRPGPETELSKNRGSATGHEHEGFVLEALVQRSQAFHVVILLHIHLLAP